MDLSYTRSQQAVLEAVRSGKDVYIAGEGGVGKTSVFKEAVNSLSRDKQILTVAPTAMAAEAVGGSTLHRAFGLPMRPLVEPLDVERITKRLQSVDVVAIDEIGGVRRDAADCIAKAVDEVSKEREVLGLKPIQVIVSGGFSFAPPVATDRDKTILNAFYGGRPTRLYAFESTLLWHRFETHVLDTCFRQKEDPELGEMLNRIRMGDESSLPYFDALADGRWPLSAVRVTQNNRAADRANAKRLSQLHGQSRIYEGVVEGGANAMDAPAPRRLELKAGARVVALADGDGYSNGSIGTVVDLMESSVVVRFDRQTKPVEVKRHRWVTHAYPSSQKHTEPEVIGSYSQLPLGLAYAMTVYKARGMSFDSITVDPAPSRGREATPGLLYAALSRCRTSAGLHLTSAISRVWIVPDPKVTDFCASIGVPVSKPATGFERPKSRVGEEGRGAAVAVGRHPDPTGEGDRNPESMTLEEIQNELHEILRNKTKWARVYDLVDYVERTAAYLEAGYRSFTAWIEAEASREGVSPSLLWHRRSAGRFYETWAAGKPNAPRLGDLPQVNEGNLNLIRKIVNRNEVSIDHLMDRLINGELSSRDLRSLWGSATARDNNLDVEKLDDINLLAGRRAVSFESGFLKVDIGNDGRLFDLLIDLFQGYFSQNSETGGQEPATNFDFNPAISTTPDSSTLNSRRSCTCSENWFSADLCAPPLTTCPSGGWRRSP